MLFHGSSFQILPFHYLQTCSWSVSIPMDLRTTSASKKIRRERSLGRYKGVRMRAWGKWVSEIRLPRSGDRIWLGSYDSQDDAARAYDAAVYCIHGESADFNFPANTRPELPRGSTVSLSKKDIQAIAADFSSADVSESSLMSSTMRTQVLSDKPASPKLIVSRDMESAYKVDSALFASRSTTGTAVTALENLKLDDFLMLDTDWIADFY